MGEASVPESVKKIAGLLKQTKSDLEKVAALFGVARAVKEDKCSVSAKQLLFRSIGVEFLKKILLTHENFDGDNCPPHVYKSVTLSILESFCSEPELARDKDMLTIVPAILDIAQLGNDDDCDDDNLMIVSEAYELLRSISVYDEGKKALLEHGAVPRFIDTYSNQSFKSDEALQILVIIVHRFGSDAWDKEDPQSFHSLMTKVTVDFETEQTERKYELCGALQALLCSCDQAATGRAGSDECWPQSVRKVLSDIVSSRLTKNQRDPALKLCSVMIETFGVEWALVDSDKPKQFLLLLVHLCSVEVRMQLEDKPVEAVMKNADLVLACFTTLELAVSYIATDELELEAKEKQQLFTALKGAFSAILTTLKKFLIKSVKNDNKPVTADEKHFTFAIIRVLAAWLAQETNAMRSTVIEVLPFILCVANDSFYAHRTWYVKNKTPKPDEVPNDHDNQKPTDILKALLPALCHFTVEEKAREIMLQSKEEDVLMECFSFHWSIVNYKPPPPPKSERLKLAKSQGGPVLPPGMAEAMKESRAAMVSMCNVFMNLIVLEPKFVETSETFYTLLKFILNNMTDLKRNEDNLVLHANMVVMGLLLLKHQADKVKHNDYSLCRYIQCAIRFLWDAFNVDESNDAEVLVVSMEYKRYWMELMELWFLGMQTISVVLTHIPWIAEFIVESGWAEGMVETLRKVRVGSLPPNTRHAYEDFLLHLVKANAAVIPVLKGLDVLTVCRNHLFMELGKFLFGD